jgi:hypothetical protein
MVVVKDGELPVTLGRAQILELRRPFPADVVRWKIQTTSANSAQIIAYIDARIAIERLNHVTPHWSDRYEQVSPTAMRCYLSVLDVTREDVGFAEGREDIRMKALYSDALKRAAVKFGVGISIYSLPVVRMRFGSGDDELDTYQNNAGKTVPVIRPRNEKNLRQRYAAWLERVGVPVFGAVIRHEAYLEAEAQGDPDTDIDPGAPSGPADGTDGSALAPMVEAAKRDAEDAYERASRKWLSLKESEKNAVVEETGFPLPQPSTFGRDLAAAVKAAQVAGNVDALVELTARMERLA